MDKFLAGLRHASAGFVRLLGMNNNTNTPTQFTHHSNEVAIDFILTAVAMGLAGPMLAGMREQAEAILSDRAEGRGL